MGPDGFLFEITGGDLSLDFTNTVAGRPTDHPKELLPAPSDLVSWAQQVGILSKKQREDLQKEAVSRPRAAERVLRQAKELRECLFLAFRNLEDGKHVPANLMQTWNRFIAQAMSHYALREAPGGITLQVQDEPFSLETILWPVVMASVQLATGPNVLKVRHCSSPTCDWLFLDVSKRGNRRWCDMRVCGNRAKARRFYQRKKEAKSKDKDSR